MSRQLDREASEREDYARTAEWADPNHLYVPKAVQKRLKEMGQEYKWLRIHIRGSETENAPSLTMREREGWRFLQPDEVPEWKNPPTVPHVKYKSLISVGDVALAVIPTERAEARRRYYQKQNRDMLNSVKGAMMKHSTSKMPMIDESSGMVTKGAKPTSFAD